MLPSCCKVALDIQTSETAALQFALLSAGRLMRILGVGTMLMLVRCWSAHNTKQLGRAA